MDSSSGGSEKQPAQIKQTIGRAVRMVYQHPQEFIGPSAVTALPFF